MKIELIVWEDSYDYTAERIYGLLEIEVYWHGGGSDCIIAEGTFYTKGRGRFENRILGTVSEDTMGVSGVILRRVGTRIK
jgi:hypothetical protein